MEYMRDKRSRGQFMGWAVGGYINLLMTNFGLLQIYKFATNPLTFSFWKTYASKRNIFH